MVKSADLGQIAKARALKVVKDLDLTNRGYMGEEYFANELVAFAASERQAVIEDCAKAVEECIRDWRRGSNIPAAIRSNGVRRGKERA